MKTTEIGIIGLGGAGGNIADEFAKRGFYAGAINFSASDLNSLEYVHEKLKLLGSEGLGHNRHEAVNLISTHYQIPLSFIETHFNSSEVIIFAFGCGGGSGSGISSLLIEMTRDMYPNKAIIAMPIIPHDDESSTALSNNQEVFEELSQLDICIMPINNQAIRNHFGNVGKGKIYRLTNEAVANSFYSLYSYTEKSSKSGSFDKRDFINLFKQRGFCSIAELIDVEYWVNKEKVSFTPNGMRVLINAVLNQSIYAPIEYDSIGKAAIIIDTQNDEIADNINNEIFNDFANQPIDVFEGIYNDEQSKFVMVVYTGLSLCKTRLGQIDTILEKRQQEIQNNLHQNNSFKSKFTNLSLPNQTQAKEQSKRSMADVINKYRKR